MKKTYEIELDGGELGRKAIEAGSDKEAMVEALEWASEVDWTMVQEGTEDQYGGCDCEKVRVDVMDDYGLVRLVRYYTIPTLGDLQETKLEDGEVIASREGEWSTERIVRLDDEFFYAHENGGRCGAWDRQCSDGAWREHPVDPTRVIDATEARRLLLDWGHSPADVHRLTSEPV